MSEARAAKCHNKEMKKLASALFVLSYAPINRYNSVFQEKKTKISGRDMFLAHFSAKPPLPCILAKASKFTSLTRELFFELES